MHNNYGRYPRRKTARGFVKKPLRGIVNKIESIRVLLNGPKKIGIVYHEKALHFAQFFLPKEQGRPIQ
jgi:hypothetical protein